MVQKRKLRQGKTLSGVSELRRQSRVQGDQGSWSSQDRVSDSREQYREREDPRDP